MSKTLSSVSLLLAALAGLSLALSGLGYRWGWWGLGPSLTMLRGAAYAGMVTAAVALVGLLLAVIARAWLAVGAAAVALVIAAAVVAVPRHWQTTARRVPPIHDITTDTDNPPRFVAILPLRAHAPNSAEYAGPALAAQQKQGYPDLAPVSFPAPPERVLSAAEATARQMGWSIVASVPAEGRLEATATTPWFGFKDDVVVRVVRIDAGSRVDVRSVSRVGRSDLGVNARRIRTFLAGLRTRLAQSPA